VAWHQQAGQQCPAILEGLAAWLLHVRGDLRPVDDPLAAELAAAWQVHGKDGVIDAVFAAGGLLASAWQPTDQDKTRIMAALG